jgi:ATP-dependent DNA helicase DinG
VSSYDEEGSQAVEDAVEAASALPSEGWLQRLNEGEPLGVIEQLLAQVRVCTYARDETGQEAGYGIETEASGLPGECRSARLARRTRQATHRRRTFRDAMAD